MGPSDSTQPASGETPEPTPDLTADEILDRMRGIRLRIEEESDEVVAQVNALSDWRSYVRRYPWTFVGAAAALGYVLVPSRKRPGTGDPTGNPTRESGTFTTDELRSVLVGAAKKAATAYASRSLGTVVSSFLVTSDTK